MAQEPDEDRIRRKAHELWVAEGHPHGRDADHWLQAREIIAVQDSQASTLLPRDSGAEEPVESSVLRQSFGDVPNLTDQGEHALTDISREPEALSPALTRSVASEAVKPLTDVKTAAAPTIAANSASASPPSKTAAKLTARPESSTKTGKSSSAKRR